MNSTFWTEERVWQLRELVGNGATAGQIAKIMGTTRNTICGKIFRLQYKRLGRVIKIPGVRLLPSPPPPPKRDPILIPMLEMGHGKCHYPMWADNTSGEPDFIHCGLQTDSAYCSEHHKLTHKRLTKCPGLDSDS